MTREEVSARFNVLPEEHRVTIIGSEIMVEIQWLEREKREVINAHKKNLMRLNERITRLAKALDKLQH